MEYFLYKHICDYFCNNVFFFFKPVFSNQNALCCRLIEHICLQFQQWICILYGRPVAPSVGHVQVCRRFAFKVTDLLQICYYVIYQKYKPSEWQVLILFIVVVFCVCSWWGVVFVVVVVVCV